MTGFHSSAGIPAAAPANAPANAPAANGTRPSLSGEDLVACLSAKDIAALSKAREARWRPGLSDQPFHSEIFARSRDASGAGVALALARDALAAAARGDDPLAEPEDRRQVLWVQDRRAVESGGRPCIHGLPPAFRDRLIHVEAKTPEDALFALEEGLRCRDLAFVIGEIVGNPRALDFTASRRLSLAAERHGVALWLVRLEARADLSSARMRWRVEASPSAPSSLGPSAYPFATQSAARRWSTPAPGTPTWKAQLFRARGHAPGQWILNDDGHLSASTTAGRSASASDDRQATAPPDPRDLVRPTVGRSLAAGARV